MKRMTAKIFVSVVTGMRCVILAPQGTVMKVPITIPASAGK